MTAWKRRTGFRSVPTDGTQTSIKDQPVSDSGSSDKVNITVDICNKQMQHENWCERKLLQRKSR